MCKFFFLGLEIEPGNLGMLGKHATTGPHPQSKQYTFRLDVQFVSLWVHS